MYSVVTPATSSLSASGMSKGMRFASASMASMKIPKAGRPMKKGHTTNQWWSACIWTMVPSRNEPERMTGTIAESSSGTS